jgi:hypothetical protein
VCPHLWCLERLRHSRLDSELHAAQCIYEGDITRHHT